MVANIDKVFGVRGHNAVRREAFDREWPCHAHSVRVDVGLIVEILNIGSAGNGSVNLPLTGDARLPPGLVHTDHVGRPAWRRLARDFPFLPAVAGKLVQFGAQWLQLCLPFVPDDVDLGIVGDVPEGDMGNALVDETLSNIAEGWGVAGGLACDVGFLALAFNTIGQQIPRIARRHDAGSGERQSHPARVDGNPAAAPLFGDIGRGAGATGRVEHEVSGVGRHQQAAFDDFFIGLNNINLVHAATRSRICPNVRNLFHGPILPVAQTGN